jgi:hypothetical protein
VDVVLIDSSRIREGLACPVAGLLGDRGRS